MAFNLSAKCGRIFRTDALTACHARTSLASRPFLNTELLFTLTLAQGPSQAALLPSIVALLQAPLLVSHLHHTRQLQTQQSLEFSRVFQASHVVAPCGWAHHEFACHAMDEQNSNVAVAHGEEEVVERHPTLPEGCEREAMGEATGALPEGYEPEGCEMSAPQPSPPPPTPSPTPPSVNPDRHQNGSIA